MLPMLLEICVIAGSTATSYCSLPKDVSWMHWLWPVHGNPGMGYLEGIQALLLSENIECNIIPRWYEYCIISNQNLLFRSDGHALKLSLLCLLECYIPVTVSCSTSLGIFCSNGDVVIAWRYVIWDKATKSSVWWLIRKTAERIWITASLSSYRKGRHDIVVSPIDAEIWGYWIHLNSQIAETFIKYQLTNVYFIGWREVTTTKDLNAQDLAAGDSGSEQSAQHVLSK